MPSLRPVLPIDLQLSLGLNVIKVVRIVVPTSREDVGIPRVQVRRFFWDRLREVRGLDLLRFRFLTGQGSATIFAALQRPPAVAVNGARWRTHPSTRRYRRTRAWLPCCLFVPHSDWFRANEASAVGGTALADSGAVRVGEARLAADLHRHRWRTGTPLWSKWFVPGLTNCGGQCQGQREGHRKQRHFSVILLAGNRRTFHPCSRFFLRERRRSGSRCGSQSCSIT